MTERNPSAGASEARTGHPLRAWVDYRRKRFWAVIAVLVYTLAGFFLVPVLVSHLVVKNVREALDREATVEEVRFNPYVLSLQADGFAIRDSDGETLAAFDTLFVNFQLSSLFRWAWTFREIRLDGPYAFHERFAPGDSRLSRLQADMERLAPPEETEETDGTLPRLLIASFDLNEGRARFLDHVPEGSVDLSAGPVTVAVQELNTLPDRHGQKQIQVRLEDGAILAWQGDIGLQPLRSSGTFTLENASLELLLPYLRAVLPLESLQATLFARTDYQLEEAGDGAVTARLTGLESRLENVAVSGLSPTSEFLSFERLEVLDGELHYPENTLELEAIRLLNPFVDAWLDEDGTPGLRQLVPSGPETQTDPTANDAAPSWNIAIGELSVAGGRLAFADRSVEPAAAVSVEGLALSLREFENVENRRMPISLDLTLAGGGSAGFEGGLVLLPELTLDGQARVSDVPLSLAQPYVQQQLALSIEDGTLTTTADVGLEATGAFRASGDLAVDRFQVIDSGRNEPLASWDRMAIDRYEVDSAATSARVSVVNFTRPYGRIHIAEDLSTNIGGLVVDGGEPAPAESDGPAWTTVLGGIAVDDGSMDFSDFSLPLPFATHVTGLEGTVSTIDSVSSEPSNIRLEGQVDEYGLARIEGSMNLLDPVVHTDVSVEFRNLLMTSLSPYSVAFAGRKIAEGKLDLDLAYTIDGGQLNGQNEVVLSDLVLGEEVDHPDAASLPLGLAVALLKDSNGVIDIELPVAGDVNDPEFRIGGVIWKAFVGLITKVVAAPFKLLGSLIGVESEDFGAFQFLAGRSDLTPPEREKVAQLSQALAQRPELRVAVGGVYDPAIDRPALQFANLRAAVFERLGRDPTEEGDTDTLLAEAIRSVLEALHAERFPDIPLESIRAAHTAPPPDDPEGKPQFDATAYSGDLRDRLLESEPVGAPELEGLADERAQAVIDAFLESGLDPNRITRDEPAAAESEDGEWVVMELGVATE